MPIDATVLENPQQLSAFLLSLVARELEEPDMSAQSNFLDLGGHSLLAVQINEQLKQELGAEFDLRVLFEQSIGDAVADLVSQVVKAPETL